MIRRTWGALWGPRWWVSWAKALLGLALICWSWGILLLFLVIVPLSMNPPGPPPILETLTNYTMFVIPPIGALAGADILERRRLRAGDVDRSWHPVFAIASGLLHLFCISAVVYLITQWKL